MLEQGKGSTFVKFFLSIDAPERTTVERVEYSRDTGELVFTFRGSPPRSFAMEKGLTDEELRTEENRLKGVFVEHVPPIDGVTFSVISGEPNTTLAIPECAVLFVGGEEDGRIIRGTDALPYVISLKTSAPRLVGYRTEVLASRAVQAAKAGGYTMEQLRRLYEKHGVQRSKQSTSSYQLTEIDGDLYIYCYVEDGIAAPSHSR